MRHFLKPLGRRQDGFALLITITLLAFLVLLLVSLATLTRVETQVAANSQQLAQARQNALMALNIALGQLQQYAGPDQRATATASLGDATSSSPADLSKQIGFSRTDSAVTGLRTPTNGTRYWTGVWGNTSNIADPTNITNIYNANPAPVILNWLVSGNTGTTPVTLNSDGGVGAPLTEAAAKIPYLPDMAIPALTDSTKATDALYIDGITTKPVALLVGPNSVNVNGSTNTGAAAKYVVAPIVPIQVASATIPGLGAGGTACIGRYAYWVGDEGVKAKYNLTDINSATANTLATDEAGFRFSAAQRNGIEILTNLASYPINNVVVNKAIQPSQIPLVDPAVTPVKVQQYYHDITVQSNGLMVDSLRGGLREDLTNRLSSGSTSPLTGAILPPTLAIVDSTLSNNVPRPSNLVGINWDILADFYQNPVDNGTTSVVMRAPTTTRGGITPIITKFRLGLSFTVTTVGAVRTLNWIVYPVIYLGNPYDIDLEVPSAGLDVRFASSNSTTGISLQHPAPTTTTNLIFTNSNITSNKTTILGGAILHIPAGTKIPAGAIRVFSLAANPVPYVPPQVVMLAMSTGVINPTFGLTMPTGITLDATYDTTRVQGTAGNGNIAVYLLPADSSSTPTPIKTQAGISSIIQQMPTHYPYAWKFGSVDFPKKNQSNGGGFNDPGISIYDYGYLYLSLRTPFSGSLYGQGPGLQIFANGNLRSSTMGEGMILNTDGSGASVSYEKQLYAEGNALTTPAARYAGYAYTNNIYPNWGDVSGAQSSVMQYSIPRRFSSSVSPFLSLAQLQHANLTSDEVASFIAYPLSGFTPTTVVNTPRQPGNAIGNAYANPIINRHLSSTFWQGSNNRKGNFYDISYLLNTKLFDSYYFSTLPQTASGSLSPLPNNRLKLSSSAPSSMSGILTPSSTAATKPDLSSATAPSKYLSIDGAFNVNSTSVEAWAAVLSGLRGLTVSTAAKQDSLVTPYPRSLRQVGQQAPPSSRRATGPTIDTYTGFRALKDTDIYDPATKTGLAVNIVQQVKSRGPFVSLSHFVNRKLTRPPSSGSSAETPQTTLGLKGALQAAIDSFGLNTAGFTSDPYFALAAPRYPSLDGTIAPTYAETPTTTATDNFVDVNAILGPRSVGAPGWLTQADILQAIGPSLASRSDTFVVRCYGDVISPLDTSATPIPVSRAWCEAVVQRLPDYVDSTVDATTKFANIPATSQAVLFGRKFKVISFRWLTVNDI